MTSKSFLRRIEILADSRGEFFTSDDGRCYYAPKPGVRLSADTLRVLAEMLDKAGRKDSINSPGLSA